MSDTQTVTAFAPASVGNVGVGFDLLGHALAGVGDAVTARRSDERGVRIVALRGVVTDLPRDAEHNTAGRVAQALLARQECGFGIELTLDKGIALGSGMGGSAASAVAAAVATNALLPAPLPHDALLAYALEGESVASGSRHADNVAPCLLGGLVLAPRGVAPRRLPVPDGLECVLVRPHLRLDTRAGRALLRAHYSLADYVTQAGHLAGFVAACYMGDLAGVRAHLVDTLIEPQRKGNIPGFDAVKTAAMSAGALGASISGSGPSIFAWCESGHAPQVQAAMSAALHALSLDYQALTSPVDAPGARIVAAQ